ncbi:uncharacterized protein LOC134284184 [Aedes albopictus]|uniref:Helix-turn-helix domain-containing protein n=1 Tax=Aedes albopictus TaxID=7160 RepID=A0ABM1YY90_AEDAL
MADVELVIKSNPDEATQDRTRCAVANAITNHIHRFNNQNTHFDPLVRFCSTAEDITRKFLKENPNVLVLKSDKGNKTVLMDAEEYKQKMKELLQDNQTYKPIDKDPTLRFERQNNSLVKRLRNLDLIDDRTAKELTKYNAVCPRIYGQPKAHKPGLPLRPVVPNVTAPSYNLSKYVGKILQQSLVSSYNVQDSFTFCEFINGVTLPDNHVLISLDVKALFTSIPKPLVINSIIMRWDEIRPNTNICLDLFLEIVGFCIDSSYFKFDGQHYAQIFGTAMGNPLSSHIADWVMEALLDNVLRSLNIPLPFLKKFVDDLVTAMPLDQLQHVLDVFNSYDIHIQFTHELEVENQLPYLDMLLIRQNNQTVKTQWYQKPIASGRFLNYLSFHPLKQKLNMAKNFAKRVHLLSTDLDMQTKQVIVEDNLKLNGYPTSLRKRIANRMNERENSSTVGTQPIQHAIGSQPTEEHLEHTYRSIPYIKHLSERVDRAIGREYPNIKLAKYNINTVGNLFSRIKDPIALDDQNNVVYHIPCSNCPACYIGMTKNRLKTRISGHRTLYNTMDRLLEQGADNTDPRMASLSERTALMQHSIQENHRFDLKQVKILEKVNKTQNLQFLEMCHIARNRHSINRRTDTDGLHAIYAGILHEIEKASKTRIANEIGNVENDNNTQTPPHTSM